MTEIFAKMSPVAGFAILKEHCRVGKISFLIRESRQDGMITIDKLDRTSHKSTKESIRFAFGLDKKWHHVDYKNIEKYRKEMISLDKATMQEDRACIVQFFQLLQEYNLDLSNCISPQDHQASNSYTNYTSFGLDDSDEPKDNAKFRKD
tara:strand:- start:16472 stop:16918 length:447 start_codon:yes stop_codon:yes gene_type:complete